MATSPLTLGPQGWLGAASGTQIVHASRNEYWQQRSG
jgi:hypothetical protein